MTAKEHYDTHLGNVYSWMPGDFYQKMCGQIEFLEIQTMTFLIGQKIRRT